MDAAQRPRLQALVGNLRNMSQQSLDFWLEHGLDAQYGGFHATLNRSGAIGAPTDKGIVQQARHCWALSHALADGALPAETAARAAASAQSLWKFMNAHMRHPDGLWVWLVSRDGRRVVDPGPALYGQFFAIYAATEYSRAFNDSAALQTALATFRATDAAFHDPARGGYDETRSAPRLHWVKLPRGGGVPRSLNVFLHATESLTSLYEASGDASVLERLAELVKIITTRLVTKDDVIYEFYDPDTWTPVGPPTINFGHNLETVWVVSATVRMLQARGQLDAAAAGQALAKLLAVAARALREGYDGAHGGVYELGVPGKAPGEGQGASTKKVWWVQAESLLAMWEAYASTGDDSYLGMLERTLKFVREHLLDPQDGEWVWQTDAAGAVIGPYGYQKGNKWKASYHDLRALLFLTRWVEARLAQE